MENLSDLDESEAAAFTDLARRVEAATLATSNADRAILMKLGLQVPHLHLHVYPFMRDATREEVMNVINGESTDDATPEEKAEFVKRLRDRIAGGEQ